MQGQGQGQDRYRDKDRDRDRDGGGCRGRDTDRHRGTGNGHVGTEIHYTDMQINRHIDADADAATDTVKLTQEHTRRTGRQNLQTRTGTTRRRTDTATHSCLPPPPRIVTAAEVVTAAVRRVEQACLLNLVSTAHPQFL